MIRLNGSSEYSSKKLIQFLKDNRIQLEPTVPYTPKQNGVLEGSNCTILEKLRYILFNLKALKDF